MYCTHTVNMNINMHRSSISTPTYWHSQNPTVISFSPSSNIRWETQNNTSVLTNTLWKTLFCTKGENKVSRQKEFSPQKQKFSHFNPELNANTQEPWAVWLYSTGLANKAAGTCWKVTMQKVQKCFFKIQSVFFSHRRLQVYPHM